MESGVDELLREIVDAVKYGDYLRAEGPDSAERLDNVRELIAGAAETVADEGGEVGLTPLDHFLQRATLVAGIDALDANADAVTLMTMHNAKGLEFPVVFITGLEDGLFPLARAYDDPAMLEEERRLFYVGITRAEEKLFLMHAEQRRRNGELIASRPSGFFDDIPDGLIERRKTMKARSSGRGFMGERGMPSRNRNDRAGLRDETSFSWGESASARRPGTPMPARRAAPAAAPVDDAEVSQDAPMLAVGARVKHRKFGSGTIAELTGSGRDAKAKIDFDDEEIGRKTLVIAQANLERGWD
jgi:DNA helicase-2/ATP-dependent DNA helicase PcrA